MLPVQGSGTTELQPRGSARGMEATSRGSKDIPRCRQTACPCSSSPYVAHRPGGSKDPQDCPVLTETCVPLLRGRRCSATLAATTQRIIRAGRRGHCPAGAGVLPDCGGALCQGPTPGSAAACKEQQPLLLLPLPPTFATTSSSPRWPRPGSVNTRRNLLRKGLGKGGKPGGREA